MISLPNMLERAARLNPQGISTTHLERNHNFLSDFIIF